MTASQLIEILKAYPGDTPVLVDGYEDGFSDISSLQEKLVLLNVNTKDYLGPHDEAPGANTKVIVICRK